MAYRADNPLIVQSDQTLMLETMGPHFAPARDALAGFAELVKSPEYVHTYRITALSLWNAAAAGTTTDQVLGALERWSKYDVPPSIPAAVRDLMGRYGRLRLLKTDEGLVLEADSDALMLEVRGQKAVKPLLRVVDARHAALRTEDRGLLKQELITVGWPVDDRAGFVDGEALAVTVRPELPDGTAWGFRTYQRHAVDGFLGGQAGVGGSGVVVLPCGAGKTIVGIGAMAALQMKTLILCTNVTALRQWREEILQRTTLLPEQVGEYSGESKVVSPVTLSTYQMLTYRKSKDSEFVHFDLFDRENWGLVIYDEVHLLPAPVFRSVAHLQARRRLGLTATLVREDGRQGDVFALIGPKRFDVPWKDLESQGWIATAECSELRVTLDEEERLRYATSDDREKFRVAALNPRKLPLLSQLVARHRGDRVLVIGMYLEQLKQIADRLGAPLITGETRQAKRDQIFDGFRRGETPVLVVSKVGNFSVDIPDANVAIQVSGSWGSRQEEAQRLGRILRPKKSGNVAHFYSLVTMETVEQTYAERRQLFLTEQGYAYKIESGDELLAAGT